MSCASGGLDRGRQTDPGHGRAGAACHWQTPFTVRIPQIQRRDRKPAGIRCASGTLHAPVCLCTGLFVSLVDFRLQGARIAPEILDPAAPAPRHNQSPPSPESHSDQLGYERSHICASPAVRTFSHARCILACQSLLIVTSVAYFSHWQIVAKSLISIY